MGLVTYGKYVNLYDLSTTFNTVLTFSPNNEYSTEKIESLIGYANSKTEEIINKKYLC